MIIIEDLFDEKITEVKKPQIPEVVDDLEQAKQRRERAIISFKLLAAVFEENSANLSAISQRSIKEVARQIKEINSFKVVTVEGHTDSIGDNQDNKVLSTQRAKAVYEELIKNGIDTGKVRYIGLGSQIPIRSDATLLGRQANRRVEIYVE
jgi:outer membrane protein OmpA-like peptidoglycan-associated protein